MFHRVIQSHEASQVNHWIHVNKQKWNFGFMKEAVGRKCFTALYKITLLADLCNIV